MPSSCSSALRSNPLMQPGRQEIREPGGSNFRGRPIDIVGRAAKLHGAFLRRPERIRGLGIAIARLSHRAWIHYIKVFLLDLKNLAGRDAPGRALRQQESPLDVGVAEEGYLCAQIGAHRQRVFE